MFFDKPRSERFARRTSVKMMYLSTYSNKYNNYEKQSAFIEEVMKPVKKFWSSEEFKM